VSEIRAKNEVVKLEQFDQMAYKKEKRQMNRENDCHTDEVFNKINREA